MTTFTAILIGAGIAFAIICLAMWGVIKSARYTRENLGKTKILTNGDKFVVMQYCYMGELLDKWSSYIRAAEARFFDGQCPDWYYLDADANIAISGFGKRNNIQFKFENIEYAKDAAELAKANYGEQREQHEYDQRKWTEVK